MGLSTDLVSTSGTPPGGAQAPSTDTLGTRPATGGAGEATEDHTVTADKGAPTQESALATSDSSLSAGEKSESGNLPTTKSADLGGTANLLSPKGGGDGDDDGGGDGGDGNGDVEPLSHVQLISKYGHMLVTDMEDSQLLLSYITRNGLQEARKVTNDTVQALISARVKLQNGTFQCEVDEAKFRENYGVLARAAAPVSVVSLRDSLPVSSHQKPAKTPPTDENSDGVKAKPSWVERLFPASHDDFSIAERACFKYRNLAFGVLLLLVFVQTYWTLCSSLYGKLSAVEAQTPPSVVATVAAQTPTAALTKVQPPPQTDPSVVASVEANVPASVDTTGTPVGLSEGGPVAIASGSAATSLAAAQLAAQQERALAYEAVTRSRIQILAFWLWPFLEHHTRDAIRAGDTSKLDVTASVVVAAGQVVSAIQAWWLPLLYGALGSMVFVVRTLSILARDRLFRREILVTLNLRVYLGTISGLAVGWFLKDGTQGTTTVTLSPFALAFVAGYGVELFFALLDKIVTSFTAPETTAKP